MKKNNKYRSHKARRIARKRFLRKTRRKQNKRKQRRLIQERGSQAISSAQSRIANREKLISRQLPPNISYLISCSKSDFHESSLKSSIPDNDGVFVVPKIFSIVDNPKESYRFLRELVSALIHQIFPIVNLDYSACESLDLNTQVFMDIILKDIIAFNRVRRAFSLPTNVKKISLVKMVNDDIKKLLFSVGSPAVHRNRTIKYDDIIPYKLCIHDREIGRSPLRIKEQKDIDTTKLVEYVLECLKKLNRALTPDKLEDLCNVIGEILINAEEHSTTKYRFSIGYFHEHKVDGNHFGVFKLVILNLGKTIYEKFKDPECPNQGIVAKMKKLSEQYTRRSFFRPSAFEEETLWTLYALQEGVTSVDPERFKKRGNGSIQFIESFFNMKGKAKVADRDSKMTILSGNTNITFDGTYNISTGQVGGEEFKFMTFNTTRNIEDRPDTKYVKFVDNYFPGTIISANILFNEEVTEEVAK